jgi:hypothetical protein
VDADFIAWEAYGRTDYTYSQSVKDAQCISKPQKKSDFTETRLADGTIDLDWTPANYYSCLDPGPSGKMSGVYEVSEFVSFTPC